VFSDESIKLETLCYKCKTISNLGVSVRSDKGSVFLSIRGYRGLTRAKKNVFSKVEDDEL
jgi:hypothetical protein